MKYLFVVIVLCVFFTSPFSFSQEFDQEIEKDYPLRSIGKLIVTNPWGDVSVQGWPFDKIRIKFKKKVQAENLEKAKSYFDSVHYSFHSSERNIEISTQYSSELNIAERLNEKAHSKISMDMILLAPANLNLRIWTTSGKINLKSWGSSSELRSNSGSIRVDGVKSNILSILCASCPIQVKNIESSLRCVGGSGPLDLHTIRGKNIYAETDTAFLKVSRVQGDQLYISKTGQIDGQFLTGKIQFHNKSGSVQLREISGFLSGSAEKGSISASIKEWEFLDKAIIESVQGNIDLVLPRHFSGDVDLKSVTGKVAIDFPVEILQDLIQAGPEPVNHLVGKIRDGGELLKIFTENGNIHVFKGKL